MANILDSFKNAWRAAADRNAARKANAKPVIPPGGFGANMDLGQSLQKDVSNFFGAFKSSTQPAAPASPTVPPRVPTPVPPTTGSPGAPMARVTPPATTQMPAPAVSRSEATAMQLLQNPRYAGVLSRPDNDPLKAEFFAELARQMPGTTPAGVADPAYTGVQPANDFTSTLQSNMTQATDNYNQYLSQVPTFVPEFQKSLKDKGYDVDTTRNQINAKRSELMRAMSRGSFENRDFEKVGRIAAEMSDLIGEAEKMNSEIKTQTDSALAFFEQSGILKQQEAEKARTALEDYFTNQNEEFKREIELAKIIGFFRGEPTVEMRKLQQDGNGTAGLSKRQQAFLTDASTWIKGLGTGEYNWGTAYNAMRSKYPEASNEEIDQALNKNEYYPR